jgi:hypothetical protein
MQAPLSTRSTDKGHLERLWVNREAAKHLPAGDHTLWNSLASTHRVYLGIGRTLLVWQYIQGEPKPVYAVTATSTGLSFAEGLHVNLESKDFKFKASHIPKRLPNTYCFLWIPMFSECRWAPLDYDRSDDDKYCTVPVCIKMASNAIKDLTEGHYYVSSVTQFRQNWPQFRDLKF